METLREKLHVLGLPSNTTFNQNNIGLNLGMCMILVAIYFLTITLGYLLLLSDGDAVERMLAAEAANARTLEEHEKILRVAATTRVGIQHNPDMVIIFALLYSTKGLATIFFMYIFSTVFFLYYSELTGTLTDYGAAFIKPLWLLSIASAINVAMKLYWGRLNLSISAAAIISPFDWNNMLHIAALKADAFTIIYILLAGSGCAAVAKIHALEGIFLVACVWILLLLTGIIWGIEIVLTI